MITKTKLKQMSQKVEEMKDDVMLLSMKKLLKYFRLDVDIKLIDPYLDELLSKKTEDLVDASIEELQKYLIIINKWAIFIRRQINLRDVYFNFIAKKRYTDLMRKRKLKIQGKSEKEKEDKLLAIDKELEELEIEKEMADAYYRLLHGFDEDIRQLHFTIQNIIKYKEKEIVQQKNTRGF